MTVHREWRDPLVIAQDHAATVRVVRSRTDPAWTRVEQPYGADGRWVAHQRRVGGLNAAVRGLARLVIEQAARIAQLEHQRLEATHPVCPTCHQNLMGIVGSCPGCDLDLALGPDDFVTAPARHNEAADQETTIAAFYNDDGYRAPTRTVLYAVRHTCSDPLLAIQDAAAAYVMANGWPHASFCWGDAIAVLPHVDGLLTRFGITAFEPKGPAVDLTVNHDASIVDAWNHNVTCIAPAHAAP
jgi:hypothetical protein